MSDAPLDLDQHRGMAAQKATDIRRVLADVENNAKDRRDRQAVLENQLLSVPRLRGRKQPRKRATSSIYMRQG